VLFNPPSKKALKANFTAPHKPKKIKKCSEVTFLKIGAIALKVRRGQWSEQKKYKWSKDIEGAKKNPRGEKF